MPQFESMTRRILALSLSFLIPAFLLWLVPAYRVLAQGLALGIVISVINGWVLYRKTLKIVESAGKREARVYGTGMLQRILLAGSAVYFAVQKTEWVSVYGVLAGLFVVQIVNLFFAFRSMRE
jgi:ATP synthase protein I